MHDFTRKNLESLGIEADAIEKLIGWHTDDMNDVLGRESKLKKQLGEQQDANSDKLNRELEELRKEFSDYKNAEAAKATAAAKAKAVKAALKSAGVADKYIDKLAKLTDFDSIELANGNIKDSEDFIRNVKNEWGDFVAVEQQQGADVPNPQQQKESAQNPKKIMEIKDAAKRQAEWKKYLDAERKE